VGGRTLHACPSRAEEALLPCCSLESVGWRAVPGPQGCASENVSTGKPTTTPGHQQLQSISSISSKRGDAWVLDVGAKPFVLLPSRRGVF